MPCLIYRCLRSCSLIVKPTGFRGLRRASTVTALLALTLPWGLSAQTFNVSLGKPVSASGHYQDRVPENAVDGDTGTRWENRSRNRVVRLDVDFQGKYLLEHATLDLGFGAGNAPSYIELQYHDGFCWRPISGATVVDNPDDSQDLEFVFTEPVVATAIRLHSMDASNNLINELSVFGEPTTLDPVAAAGTCTAGEHVPVLDPYYDYALHLPPGYNDDVNARWPLIISLHGIGGNVLTDDRSAVRSSPEGFAKQIANGTLDDFAAIVVSGHCRAVGQTSNCWFDAARLELMLDSLQEDFLVDLNRVFFTGLSGGSIVSYRMGVRLHERLAGLVPVAGLFPGNKQSEICNLKRLHIWAFAGTADPDFPPGRNDFVRDQLLDCPPLGEDHMESTAIEGGTHSGSTWDVAYSMPELHQWLLTTTKLDPIVAEVPIFEDGFESGNTLRWSLTMPPENIDANHVSKE